MPKLGIGILNSKGFRESVRSVPLFFSIFKEELKIINHSFLVKVNNLEL